MGVGIGISVDADTSIGVGIDTSADICTGIGFGSSIGVISDSVAIGICTCAGLYAGVILV